VSPGRPWIIVTTSISGGKYRWQVQVASMDIDEVLASQLQMEVKTMENTYKVKLK